MQVEIIDKKLKLDIYGFSGFAVNKDYAEMAFKLMDQMWQVVKLHHLRNKGLNIWVYGLNESVFSGVELYEHPISGTGLDHKEIDLLRYAYYKHIGPYHLIKQVGQQMREELKKKGMETCFPYVEIYGHWTSDEMKLETELLMCIK